MSPSGGVRSMSMVVLLADVQLAADDRLDARGLGGVHEMHRAKDVAVIGHGHGRHAEFLHALDQLLDVASAVEHRVIGVQVQMDELRHELGSNPNLVI